MSSDLMRLDRGAQTIIRQIKNEYGLQSNGDAVRFLQEHFSMEGTPRTTLALERIAAALEGQPTANVSLKRDAPAPGPQTPLRKALQEWRTAIAAKKDKPAFVVAKNRTLDEIAGRRPKTKEGLAEVYGMGPSKVEKYGDQILEIVKTAR